METPRRGEAHSRFGRSRKSKSDSGIVVLDERRKGLSDKLHRYLVRYIERDGHTDKTTVWASSKGEARRIASDRGCDDILKVRRVGISFLPLIVVLLILSLIVYLAVN